MSSNPRLNLAKHILATLFAALLVAGYSWADDSLVIDDVEIGLGGMCKLGHWAPVSVTVQGGAADEEVRLFITAADGDGLPCRYNAASDKIQISAGQPTVVRQYIRVGRVGVPITVTCRSTATDEVLATKSQPYANSPGELMTRSSMEQVALVAGPEIGIQSALQLRRRREGDATHPFVQIGDATRLPDQWYGYDGFDVVILSTGDSAFNSSLTPVQIDALERWVLLGGHLILSVGKNADELVAAGGPLERFVPGEFEKVIRQTETADLEDYSQSRIKLDALWNRLPSSERGLDVARIKVAKGRIAAIDGIRRNRTPWVIRSTHGFGTVCLATVDLDVGYMAEWGGRDRLVARMVDDSLAEQAKSDGDSQTSSSAVTHLGFSDLSGQLRSAMDQFAGVRLVPFSLIATVAVLYILLIGPVDYLLLKRLAPRMEWTWLTFPLVVLALSCLAFWLARSWKGTTPHQNIVDLVDYDTSTGTVRGTSWAHLYPVTAGRYDIDAQPNEKLFTREGDQGALLSWQGLAGSGLGGMQDRASAAPFSDRYEIQSDSDVHMKIGDLPIPTWSSRGLVCVWWGDAGDSSPGSESSDSRPKQSELVPVRNNQLDGSFRNPLPVTIRDAAVAYDRFYYQIGTLQPGQKFQMQDSQAKDFRYRLTRRRIMAEDGREVVSPWDKGSLDISRIMEMVMFHDRAGGRGYTDLYHRYHAELDMSDQIVTGEAVLYGRLELPATEWSCGDLSFSDADVRRWTFCRILFPVNEHAVDGEEE